MLKLIDLYTEPCWWLVLCPVLWPRTRRTECRANAAMEAYNPYTVSVGRHHTVDL